MGKIRFSIQRVKSQISLSCVQEYYCKCHVALPHGAVGLSAVCDCGISGSYSLNFRFFVVFIKT